MQAEITNAILSALGTILVALIGYVARKVAEYLKEKGITEKLSTKQYLADIVVNAAEQIYQHEDGEGKFRKAKNDLIILFNENGLPIDSKELDLLIEASVKAMNDGFNSVKEKDEMIEITHEVKGVDE